MRVAVVTVDTPHTVDTARTRRMDRIARQLSAEDHEVTVCCTQWWDGSVSSFEQGGVTYRRVTRKRSTRRFATKLPLTLHRVKPDVVHASYWPPGVAASAATARWLGRTPVLLDWYGDEPVDPEARLTKSALGLPNLLITPSRHVDTKVRELGADGDRTRIVPESIDVDFIRAQSAADRPDVVTAGQLDAEANVDQMLLGLAELRDRDWTAMVIGDGPARDRYEQKAAELRIDNRVEFAGELPLERRISHYKAAHAFVQTAERCPFALELLRALSCGCVGIVDYREDSAAHELVEAFDRGYRTTTPEALSEAIVEAGEKDELEYNDEFDTYDHDIILKRYLDVYAELLD